MSAYIVDDKTVNRIIANLECTRDFDWCKREILQAAGIPEIGKWQEALGYQMALMNDAAVNARYCEGTAQSDRGRPYVYKQELPDTILQQHKSLSCFLYQCAEGDVPELPLYKALKEYENSIAYHFISNHRDYSTAQWA